MWVIVVVNVNVSEAGSRKKEKKKKALPKPLDIQSTGVRVQHEGTVTGGARGLVSLEK